jgi:adenine-specific DNA-methyltransferase
MSIGLNKAEIQSDRAITAHKRNKPQPTLPDERMKVFLMYPGKLPEAAILEPVKEDYLKLPSSNPVTCPIEANGFVLSDNWLALHTLRNQKIRPTLIYLDPPYGTGLDFQSRQLEHAYDDTMGDATYIEFIRRRLVLMREILADDGSIYLHIGHQMLSHLKVIMDEVFGESNFRNLIIRRKCSSKNFTKNQYSNLNDYILFYSKSSRYKWNQPMIQPSEEWLDKEYTKSDEKGRYKLVPIHAPGVRHGETGKPWRDMQPPPGKHWQYAPSKLEELDKNGEIYWSKNGNPRRKIYLSNAKGMVMTDYWDQYRDAHHQSILVTGYPTEKNLDMLKLIVSASSDEGDLVLDPFCGSGTTLQAAEELGRRWIGIDQSFTAAKATLGRLTHGLAPMGDFVVKKESPQSALPGLEEPRKEVRKLHSSDFSFFVDSEVAANFPDEVEKLAAIPGLAAKKK